MRLLKKTFLILFVAMFLIPSFLFAGGGKEKESNDNYTSQTEFYDEFVQEKLDALADEQAKNASKHSAMYGLLHSIANVYDEITAMFCVSMTPFPSMFVKFYYDTPPGLADLLATDENGVTHTNYPHLSLRSALLLRYNYYTEDMPAGSQRGEEGTRLVFTRQSDGKTLSFMGRPTTAEQSFFGMVSILFFSFFLLEVLFSAIYGYLTDKDGGVFRDIVSKGVLCILMFLLAAALPFLVEAFRVGFISMASVATGLDSMIKNATGSQQSFYMDLQHSKVYEYPGLLIRSLADVIDMLNPANIGMTGINLIENMEAVDTEGTNFGGLVNALFKILISIVYLLIQVVATVLILFSALHVMLNVCEVYLLLAGVMCLLPFTVFSPLKFLGEKAVMSLFSNIIELFVLVIIMFTTLSVGTSVSKSLLNGIVFSPTEIAITFTDIKVNSTNQYIQQLLNSADFSNMYIGPNNEKISKDIYDGMDDNEKRQVKLAPITIVVENSITVEDNSSTQDENEQSAAIEKWINDLAVNALKPGLRERPDLHSAYKQTMIYDVWQSDAESIDPMKVQQQIDVINFTSLPIADKVKVIEAIDEEIWHGQVKYEMETLAQVMDTRLDLSFFGMHIILSLLAIFMSTYFVNQSSQITNALLSGNVASEGITAAMGKALVGKAMGGMMKLGTKPIKMAGAGAGLGMGAMGDKAASSGHTGLASALYMGGGKAAQARHDRQKMIDEAQNGFGSKKNSSSE